MNGGQKVADINPAIMKIVRTQLPAALIATLILLVGVTVYLPGVAGPFFFDDYSNLLGNTYLRIRSLDFNSLYQAAFSLAAGPLQRPVAMASFAINYYVAGDFENPVPYKLVNISLHFVNGLLVYWLVRLILERLARAPDLNRGAANFASASTMAIAVSLAWLVHPIQSTSVLYVVQRMNELAALFTLLGLLCYLTGRASWSSGHQRKAVLLFAIGLFVFWPAGLFSKENALLLPVFVLVLEYVLFSSESPWRHGSRLTSRIRVLLLVGFTIAFAALAFAAFDYAQHGYATRLFTMIERVLTQPRVLFLYIALIFVPRIDQYALFHDDLTVSTSLFTPWTTLPSVLGIVGLLITAIAVRRRFPLISLGILWFFAGHLLESTIFALELMHEHRNYLPLLGVLLALLGGLTAIGARIGKPLPYFVLPVLILIFASVTVVRAWQWSSEPSMAYYEAMHRPDSAASQSRYANLLLSHGHYEESLKIARRAAELAPHEPSHLIGITAVVVPRGGQLRPGDDETIRKLLATNPISATTIYELSHISNCITRECTVLQPYLEGWMQAMLANPHAKDASYSYFIMGRALLGQGKFREAIEAYKQSFELDRNYAHPLLDLIELYLFLDRPDYAEIILGEVRRVNERTIYKRDGEIERLTKKIAQHKRTTGSKARGGPS